MKIAVVGTDTGVGKTVVTAGLVGALRERGCDARAVKPAQTGFPPDDDANVVATVCDDPDAAVCLRYLTEPLAPAVAAEHEDADLSYQSIQEETAAALTDAAVGVLEGIGGLRVPLADGREVVDLVAALDCFAVVVARSGLGTLNHTALTIEALQRRNVPVLAVVLNEYDGTTIAERSNPHTLETMIDAPVVTMPSVEQADLIDTASERLLPLLDPLPARGAPDS
ncbi:dethiobiotin synthase [Halocatena pleomorpha]|uniref:ATP-dependent dethiobiotin synthetase BioD n=1 Tax=Halocatena pleomorpha TaxID=1785090 RepID=A0A3P3RLL6_9EURY|nr:dethiobiotin synthase [Halocatena pleomorpha]RRJ33750.1 dethiobiotin synthase [Halocatena pleomorpha]